MLYVVPIEPLEERYSAQWLKWTKRYLVQNKVEHSIILPKHRYSKIQNGAFLDVVKTNLFKAEQLRQMMLLFELGEVKDGDVFWFHDLWFPGIEMLFYIRNALGIKFKIFGCLHAGTYDPNDYLTRVGMYDWARGLEESWLNEADGIFVATHYHKELLCETRVYSDNNVYVSGFPFISKDIRKGVHTQRSEQEKIIVFPHRLDPEKQPEKFDQLEELIKQDKRCKDWTFIKTKDTCKNKTDYYETLAKSHIAVSFALQETWGIAMQEAATLGAVPVVPSRLSYVEMYDAPGWCDDGVFFDGSVQGAADKIKHILLNKYPIYTHLCSYFANRIEDRGALALVKMFYKMGVLECARAV